MKSGVETSKDRPALIPQDYLARRVMKKDPVKVSIIDDHPIILKGLQLALKSAPNIDLLSAYLDPDMFFADIQDNKPDVLILDVHIGERCAFKVCSSLSEMAPEV